MTLDELKSQSDSSDANAFYISFSDLMVVLATFFVMLLAMSKVDIGSFEKVKVGVTGSKKDTLVELSEKLAAIAAKTEGVTVRMAKDGVRLDMDSVALFEIGSASLKSNALHPLRPMLREILQTKYDLDVEGHTDDQAYYRLEDGEIKNNWSLSGRRAAAVVNYLLEYGFAESRLRVVGYASTRPRYRIQGVRGKVLEAARAKNRRVSILVR